MSLQEPKPWYKRTWLKWTLSTAAVILIMACSYVAYLYQQVTSISLEDIEKRVEAQEGGVELQATPKSVPLVVEKTIDIANGFASKPIETQDALDVAAILLKSGLSMKDVYYLTGKSTDKLSNDEKQEIRDKLLAKLTPVEIKALRSITKEYGKGLVILDPNYPIELVGVYDEAEREKIKKELASKKGQDQVPSQVTSSAAPTSKPTPIPSAKVEETPAPEATANRESELEVKYQGLLSQLQNSCNAEASRLVGEIAAKLKSDREAGKSLKISELESTYLQRVTQAESRCDSEFNKLMSQAKKDYTAAGSSADPTAQWRKTYEASKEAARNQAIVTLSASLSGGGS